MGMEIGFGGAGDSADGTVGPLGTEAQICGIHPKSCTQFVQKFLSKRDGSHEMVRFEPELRKFRQQSQARWYGSTELVPIQVQCAQFH